MTGFEAHIPLITSTATMLSAMAGAMWRVTRKANKYVDMLNGRIVSTDIHFEALDAHDTATTLALNQITSSLERMAATQERQQEVLDYLLVGIHTGRTRQADRPAPRTRRKKP